MKSNSASILVDCVQFCFILYKCVSVSTCVCPEVSPGAVCTYPALPSPVCECVVSLTTLSQMLQSPWGWCCLMKLPPPREMLAREEVSRENCFYFCPPYWRFSFLFQATILQFRGVTSVRRCKKGVCLNSCWIA